eukprot:3148263-Pleurochrysis_carterae.AAC.1
MRRRGPCKIYLSSSLIDRKSFSKRELRAEPQRESKSGEALIGTKISAARAAVLEVCYSVQVKPIYWTVRIRSIRDNNEYAYGVQNKQTCFLTLQIFVTRF